jgi:eukaryotic-like serine/threonine-protein kinase
MSRLLARVSAPGDRDDTPTTADDTPTTADDKPTTPDDPLLSFQAESATPTEAVPEAAPGRAVNAATTRRALRVAAAIVSVVAVVAAASFYLQPAQTAPVGMPLPAAAVSAETVTFTSEPPGASVTLDGIPRGVTPLKIPVTVGPHDAEIASGAVKRVVSFAVEPNRFVTHHVEFAAAAPVAQTGRLEVLTDPPGARVSVDGAPRGTTPLTVASIGIGEHRVTIAADRTTIQRSVTVSAGTTATVVAAIAPSGAAGGWAQITAPIELQVFENGQLLGSTTTARLMLPAGRHDLEVANAAFEFRAPLRIDIDPGQTVSVPVSIPSGLLSVNAVPWADVSVDGRPVGITPLGNLSLPIGAHEIVWRHPQLGERRRTVSVTARTPVRVGMDLSK